MSHRHISINIMLATVRAALDLVYTRDLDFLQAGERPTRQAACEWSDLENITKTDCVTSSLPMLSKKRGFEALG